MTARSPDLGVSILKIAGAGAARRRSATTTGARRRRETAPRHAGRHVVLLTLVIGSHGAASSSMSSFDAANIERTARAVNEMAIHICGGRAGALLHVRAVADGFVSP